MSVSDRVKLLITKASMKQKDFADALGISAPRLNNYLSGSREVPQEIINRIVKLTGCEHKWLLTGEGDMYNIVPAREGYLNRFIRLPVVGDIAAGFPIELIPDEPTEYIEVASSLLTLPPPYHVFRVDGESMLPVIHPGDYVVISADWRGISLSGRILAFRNDDGITLKQYVLDPPHKTAWLWPINSAYNPIPYTKDSPQLSLVGVLILSIRKYT